MLRLRVLRRSLVTVRSKAPNPGRVTEYRPSGLPSSQGNAAGVIIDGVVYTLQGEPPTAKPGSWFKFH